MKLALVSIVVVLAACSARKNELPQEAWGRDDYAKAGLRVEGPWTAADHEHAANVLKEATAGHRERLPRYRGAKSGPVFEQLIAALPADDNQPVADRFIAHVQRYEATNQLSKLYVENALAPPTREWIELMGALLRESVILTTTGDAFLATFPADDPSRETRMNGFAKMKHGYGMMLFGGVLVAGNQQVPERDRVALIAHVTTALPALFPHVPADTQRQIRDQLAKLVEALPAGELKTAVAAAQHALP